MLLPISFKHLFLTINIFVFIFFYSKIGFYAQNVLVNFISKYYILITSTTIPVGVISNDFFDDFYGFMVVSHFYYYHYSFLAKTVGQIFLT